MRKEIAPELYNYNKFPGPEFHLHGDKVETEGIAFSCIAARFAVKCGYTFTRRPNDEGNHQRA